MDRYQETFSTWNKVASLYQDKFMDLTLYNDSYDLICNTVKKEHAKILEIGCGPGNITRYLLSRRPDFDVFGIDVAPNMIELARQNNPSARFKVMDARQINSIDSMFDGIVCGFCLPYLSQADSARFIADCAALLNEGGIFYLSFVEGDPDKSDFQVAGTGDRSFFYFHSLVEIQEQFNKNGLLNLNLLRVEYPRSEMENELHTIVTAIKN